ncbi:MAG: hypothetical protein Q4F53_03245 [Nesterenkonia sp.]|uniref:hypothetical protein n=1 Tax=Nesterenkonia marinintestina TaxID=2979865 RepID=UPI0021C13238|nr:hypothetical protein [Nesterenkonia sp. GX14115]MDO5492614.1 hypothetical protein [Nesterenkonia sp.]
MGSKTLETSERTAGRERAFFALGDAVGIEEEGRPALGSPHHHLAGLALVASMTALVTVAQPSNALAPLDWAFGWTLAAVVPAAGLTWVCARYYCRAFGLPIRAGVPLQMGLGATALAGGVALGGVLPGYAESVDSFLLQVIGALSVVVIGVAPVHGVLSTLLMKHERGYAD